MRVKNALISVADKTGLAELAAALAGPAGINVRIYSTGGTATALAAAGVEVTDVSHLTGGGEMLGGRVKTLHPNIHAAILADMQDAAHRQELADLGLPKLDLVVVNFYPFARAAEGDKIANIDIGGPAMARAAAKNHASTVVLTAPADYPVFIGQLKKNNGDIGDDNRRQWAAKAFVSVAALDAAIANYFSANGATSASGAASGFPPHRFLHLEKIADLSYGENPHQAAACYARAGGADDFAQLQGAPASYNNLLDAHSACLTVGMHTPPAAAIIKHNNPCAVAIADTPKKALQNAYRADKKSAYGGIVAFNRPVDGDAAAELHKSFWEVIVAPQFNAEAKAFLAEKGRAKLFVSSAFFGHRQMLTGNDRMLLIQTPDHVDGDGDGEVVSEKQPSEAQRQDLFFAWRVAAAVKSNAIVIAKDGATVGIGAGQMSRVDSAWLACEKAKQAKRKTAGASAASDGFFPFSDGLEKLAETGIAAIIQPGGSKNDGDIIAAADKLGIAMIFSGRRHFRH